MIFFTRWMNLAMTSCQSVTRLVYYINCQSGARGRGAIVAVNSTSGQGINRRAVLNGP